MHPYQIDGEIRVRTFLSAALFSVFAARILSWGLQLLPFPIPWWVETPSVLGFFGLFMWLFDNYLWRTALVQRIEWFCIPDLNGTWHTEIRSSYSGFDKPIQGIALIRQTATKMCIALRTDGSSSFSVHAALIRADKLSKHELTYNFVNRPQADALSTMSMHHGTAWLNIHDDGQVLDGEYYSGRGRQNFGRIILRRGSRSESRQQ